MIGQQSTTPSPVSQFVPVRAPIAMASAESKVGAATPSATVRTTSMDVPYRGAFLLYDASPAIR